MMKRLFLLLVVLMFASCTKTKPVPVQPQEEEAAAVEAGAPEVEKATGEAVEGKEEAPVPEGEKQEGTVSERDRLKQCYIEVYCAQKKGEMSKLLDIYKSHGYETPQDFSRAWIEAAKDTDWVTKLAYEVSKKCPTEK